MTGRWLANPPRYERRPDPARPAGAGWLGVAGARLHNLKQLDIEIPPGAVTCVTGVSGSGKSTFCRHVLFDGVREALAGRAPDPARCSSIQLPAELQRAFEVDQSPIGRTPRSCPATYTKLWDHIRRLYAGTAEARMRGYPAARFSFNVPGGRCPVCDGQGVQRLEMSFLPDVEVPCETCGGARFNRETREVRFRERSIAQVLDMVVGEALEFFASQPRIRTTLELLRDVGLDYLTLGQRSPTLSGGEAQRIKLVSELARRPGPATATEGRCLYVLDEPTVGLHMADVGKLVLVLRRLAEAGHWVVVVEHNLDMIAQADWVVDLGPEGGERGGQLIASGPPAQLARNKLSHTGRFLAAHLAR